MLRFGLRLGTTHPPRASTGNSFLDRVGQATHWVFYLLILGMVMSGMAMARSYGLFDIVFGGSDAPLPPVFDNAPRAAHGVFATGLIALIVLHIAAAVYHQAVLKDGLLRRMWFGRRRADYRSLILGRSASVTARSRTATIAKAARRPAASAKNPMTGGPKKNPP